METKSLSFNQMERIEGGISAGCWSSLGGLGLSVAGGLIGMATLNPIGIGMGIAGIYLGTIGAVSSCGG